MPSPLKSPLVTLRELSDRSSNVDKNGGNSYAAMSLCGGKSGPSDAPGREDVTLSHGTHGVLASLSSSKVPASQTMQSDNGVALCIPAEHAETSCMARHLTSACGSTLYSSFDNDGNDSETLSA
jgi:hypothetical protein